MTNEEKINSILKRIENETKKLENYYINICENISNLTNYIRINKSYLSIELIKKISNSLNNYTEKILVEIKNRNFYDLENNHLNDVISQFSDMCEYVILYKEKINEYTDDIYKDFYNNK